MLLTIFKEFLIKIGIIKPYHRNFVKLAEVSEEMAEIFSSGNLDVGKVQENLAVVEKLLEEMKDE